LESTFDVLIDSFIANQIGIVDQFLTIELANHLKDNLLLLKSNQQLFNAGIGTKAIIDSTKIVRGDKIFWLDRLHNDPYENAFFDLMDAFIIYLNATCYTGIKSYEFHYTLYEKGTFYKQHIDQFQNNDDRKYSMIFYLNENWIKADGGELCIHQLNNIKSISPNNGKSVFFKSNELLHEVLKTNKQRLSITGWLKTN
jgi:SM-20-related protein